MPDDPQLVATEQEIHKLMRQIQNDRYSSESGQIFLTGSATTIGIQQFVYRLFHIFYYTHTSQFPAAVQILTSILSDEQSPSITLKLAITLWKELITRCITLCNQQDTSVILQQERECAAIARKLCIIHEPFTKQNEQVDWAWEHLIHSEARWLAQQLPDHNNPHNRACVYYPGLLGQEWYQSKQFHSAAILEEAYPQIMEELRPFLAHHSSSLFNHVGGNTAETDANLVKQGKWQDISLWSAGQKNTKVCDQLPVLSKLLEEHAPEVTRSVCGHALLSRLSPGTIVNRHHGYSNNQLTLHLGLIVPKATDYPDYDINLGIEVNDQRGAWEEGKAIVFDDSFYHSVWYRYNKKGEAEQTCQSYVDDQDKKTKEQSQSQQEDNDPTRPCDRLILLLRFYHPEYTLEERAHLAMTHVQTPWTIQQRMDESHHLLTDKDVKRQWLQRKLKFLATPPTVTAIPVQTQA